MAICENSLHAHAFSQQMKITDEDWVIWTGLTWSSGGSCPLPISYPFSSSLSATCCFLSCLISPLTFPLANHSFVYTHTSPVLWHSSWTYQPLKMRPPSLKI
jgi:hypothetical protein